MEIREAHFPRRAPLDAYGNGGFRFAEMSHRGSLLCLPSGIYGWNYTAFDELNLSAFEKLFAEQDEVEVLLIGTGPELRPIPKDLKQAFREAGIISDSMSTGAAVRTFNVMLAEDRAVAAAVLAID